MSRKTMSSERKRLVYLHCKVKYTDHPSRWVNARAALLPDGSWKLAKCQLFPSGGTVPSYHCYSLSQRRA